MDHVAIMNKRLGLIDRILAGKKIIETRWYKNKTVPWGKVFIDDMIYFKDSGGLVRARARVAKVLQYENLNLETIRKIVKDYGDEIDISGDRNDLSWADGKNYAILIWLSNVEKVLPFEIDKIGFGSGCAWISTDNIDIIRKQKPAVTERLGGSL